MPTILRSSKPRLALAVPLLLAPFALAGCGDSSASHPAPDTGSAPPRSTQADAPVAPDASLAATSAKPDPAAAAGEVTIVQETYASGKPYNEHGEKVLPSGKRVRHGPIAAWFEEGGKMLEGNYTDGKLDGWWRYWHKNGQLEREGQYVNGLQQGYWVAHWDNGQRMSEGEMRAGMYVGRWRAWHRDGKLRYEGEFVDGKREGTWLFFSPDGTPDASLTGEYKNNVKVD